MSETPVSSPKPPEPWASFLLALDGILKEEVQLHCLGGFVATILFGLPRPTSDIDVLAVVPNPMLSELREIAGEGSTLHAKYGVYLDPTTIANYPENYEDRLIPMWPESGFRRLRLYALEPHDLALTKLERNSDVDRQDVQDLAAAGLLNEASLRERYLTEFRPNLVSGVARHDLTLELWIDMCWSGQGKITTA